MADGVRRADGPSGDCAEISSRVPEDHGIELLHLGDEDATVVVLVDDARWLIREVGRYEGITNEGAEFIAPGYPLSDYTGEYPFCTSGTRWAINLNTGEGARRYFYAQEGQIQGLRYALDALMYGGNLTPGEYADYIKRLLDDENRGALGTDPEFDAIRKQAGL